jgi:hypothetical protein
MTQQEIALKVLRSIHAIFVVSILLYAFTAEKMVRTTTSPPQPILIAILLAAAAGAIFIALRVRRQMIQPAIESLRLQAEDVRALNRWRLGTLISFVLVECVALCGFVLRVLGAPRPRALPFYLLAILLMLAWTPRLASAPSAPR